MADDDHDQDDKTQDPSERRIDKALDEGNVPRSQDLNGFFVLAAGLGVVGLSLPSLGPGEARRLGGVFSRLHDGIEGRGAAVMGEMASSLFLSLAPVFLAVTVAALAANLIMHRPRLVTAPLMPKFNRISPMAGAKRLFGAENLVQFGKTLAKLALAGGVTVAVLWPDAATVQRLTAITDITLAIPVAARMSVRLVGAVLALYAIIALADAVYQAFSWKKRLRMTQHEVKEEHKETDGNPEIKAKLRQIRNQRMRQRMMAAVPEATVIITNPTHYAVALKYDPAMQAPVCVAKGVDEVALKIREVAGAHSIPIVENPPLARALYATVDLDEMIPADHYKAVAEVIGYVLRLAKRRRP